MTKLAPKSNRNRTNAAKEAAIDEVSKPDDYLNSPVHNGRFDVDKRLHRALKNLGTVTENPVNDKGNIKIKSVTMRMLMTEAVLDLLKKYNDGNGKYPFEEGESWDWE